VQAFRLDMIQNLFEACPALAVIPSQHRYEDSGVKWRRKIDRVG